MPKKTKKDEIVKLELKKHHLYGAVGILIGVLGGFLIWGQSPATAAPEAAVTSIPGAPAIVRRGHW